MSRMERFFTLIARFNSVMSLVIVFGVIGLVIWGAWKSHVWHDRAVIEVANPKVSTNSKVLMRFGRVEKINGAHAQMITLLGQESSSSLASGGYSSNGEIRNVLFLVGKNSQANWLFPNQANHILVIEQLQQVVDDRNKTSPTHALYFEYVNSDSNAETLSVDNLLHIGFTKPDGSGFVEVLNGVNRVLSYQLTDEEQIAIIYQAGRAVRHAKFSVLNFEKQLDKELVFIPHNE